MDGMIVDEDGDGETQDGPTASQEWDKEANRTDE
jgi:hypothetical protein